MNIAVTGSMGSGKSRVAVKLADMLFAELINVDHICRDLLQPGCECLTLLKKITPNTCFEADGSLDRPAFRQKIFADKSFRKRVDAVIHPLVREQILALCRKGKENAKCIVVEIPLLFETGWQDDFDCSLLVYANDELCVKRIMQRDQVTELSAHLSLNAQMPISEKVLLADQLVDNSATFAETVDQLEYLIKKGCFVRKTKPAMNNT